MSWPTFITKQDWGCRKQQPFGWGCHDSLIFFENFTWRISEQKDSPTRRKRLHESISIPESDFFSFSVSRFRATNRTNCRMPSSSEYRCRRRRLISITERSLTIHWSREGWLLWTVKWQIHKHRRGISYVWGRRERPLRWGVVFTESRRGVVWKELLELLLKNCHVLMLLLKLGVTLIEALKYVVLLLHVALLFKEALEPLIRLLLPLLILLKWVTACNVNATKKRNSHRWHVCSSKNNWYELKRLLNKKFDESRHKIQYTAA